jgi:hypothetical protein
MLLRPASIFGSSDGAMGSIAILSTDSVMCFIGRKMYKSSSMEVEAIVAVLEIEASTPPMSMRFPAATSSAGMKYLPN